jgi:hypothetical protein
MENCAFIDVFTTCNDLYGKNNCPIQFCCEIFTSSEVFTDSFFSAKRKMLVNMIPDEEILVQGYINSGFKNEHDLKKVDALELREALTKIYNLLNVLKAKSFFIIGYNHMSYDMRILNESFKRVLSLDPIEFPKDKVIDLMRLAEIRIPVDRIGSYSMDSVLTYLADDYEDVRKIRSKGKSTEIDIEVAKRIFHKLMTGFMDPEVRFSDVVEFINSPHDVKVLNFGKYKGAGLMYVFENDRQYCNWLIKTKSMVDGHPDSVDAMKKLMNTVVE